MGYTFFAVLGTICIPFIYKPAKWYYVLTAYAFGPFIALPVSGGSNVWPGGAFEPLMVYSPLAEGRRKPHRLGGDACAGAAGESRYLLAPDVLPGCLVPCRTPTALA